MDAPAYTVAVRTLCEFAAKHGDLDARFTPSPTAEQGQAGHRAVAARRPAPHRSEVALQGDHRHLRVRGRADGVNDAHELLIEVKTYRGHLDRLPANHRFLHWAQAKVYAALLCAQNGAASWQVGLVYLHADTLEEAPPLIERFSAVELTAFFHGLCEHYLAWADQELAHRRARDTFLRALPFPHAQFRAGQRALAEAVFRAARDGRCLMAQAPTGIGKTLGTVFPMLKALADPSLDQLYFLTAKGSGRGVALQTLRTLLATGGAGPAGRQADPTAHPTTDHPADHPADRPADHPADRPADHPADLPADQPPKPHLRVIELVARDKACEHPGHACHGDDCPLARGFYDRLGAARQDAARHTGLLCQATLRDIARRHAVCPYHLGQEMARWCDVVVGDFNHYFDIAAPLFALAQQEGRKVVVLVDEAHNLVDRARACYSAQLDPAGLTAARAVAPASLQPALERLSRAWGQLAREHPAAYHVLTLPPHLPLVFVNAVKALKDAMGDTLADQGHTAPLPLLDLYFAVLDLLRLLESFDSTHSLVDLTAVAADGSADAPGAARRGGRPRPVVCLRNVTPADFLKPRFAAARCVVLFSATLAPQAFYADTLGVPADTAWVDVETPFSADQLSVRVVSGLSTRFRHRADSAGPMADLIAGQFAKQPGNYLAFFSSFDHLKLAADALAARHPQVPAWRQTRGMAEAARDAFLARFVPQGAGVGFAVLGGVFAEGIDLPGTRLVGALIATLGLPQFNPVNEALRERLQQRFGAGFEYAYLYPGLRKVVQAAGRVLRTPTDTGSIHLIDERFRRPEVRRLLPAWWRIETA